MKELFERRIARIVEAAKTLGQRLKYTLAPHSGDKSEDSMSSDQVKAVGVFTLLLKSEAYNLQGNTEEREELEPLQRLLLGSKEKPANYESWSEAAILLDVKMTKLSSTLQALPVNLDPSYEHIPLQKEALKTALDSLARAISKLLDLIAHDYSKSHTPEEVTRLMSSVVAGLKTYEPPTQVAHND